MKRRIIAALAATGLAVTMAVGLAPASQAATTWGSPYVAIGDSVAAGTGNMPYVHEDCRRSNKAYPNVLAGMLGGAVVSAACAGNSTMLVKQQATDLAGDGILGPDTQLVTITAGVNDLPWIPVLLACSSLGTPEQCAQATGAVPGAGAMVVPGIVDLLWTVRTFAPGADIAITGYPHPFGDFSGTCSIGAAAPGKPMKFSEASGDGINAAVDGLNQAIQAGIGVYQAQFAASLGQGSTDAGVQWVGVTDAFDHHGFCDTGERWIGGMVPTGPVKDRGFHPNVAGQRAYATAIANRPMP